MKKLLTILAATAILFSFMGCESTGGSSSSGKKTVQAFADHPFTYTLDIMDGLKDGVISFVDNSQYGTPGKSTRQNNANSNFSTCPEWTQLVRLNKPRAGDKIRVTGKFVSDMDIDAINFNVVDPSPDANYWLVLGDGEPAIEDIKAGEVVEIDYTFDLIESMKGGLILNMAYGEQNGDFAKLKCERVGESDIGAIEGVVADDPQHKEPKTWEFDVSRQFAYFEMAAEYPWVNGQQDTMADPFQYSGRGPILSLFPEGDMPIKGDKIHLTWKTRGNVDISEIKVRAVENSSAVDGWWKEIDALGSAGRVFATNVKANEVNTFDLEVELADAPIADLTIFIWYEPSAADGSSLFTYVRDTEDAK